MELSVFGLGKLGAPLAAVMASKGHRVIGYDVDPGSVSLLGDGKAPVAEPGLAELIRQCAARLSATTDATEAVLNSDVTFVVVPTPSEANGAFSTRFVLDAARRIGEAIRQKTRYHLIVLTSTVMPGATAGEFVPCLEEAARKPCGETFGVCYNPEFVALGNVIHDMWNPDFILIGESDARAGSLLAGIYERVCENKPPIARMNFVNAELAKLAVNTYVTTKISFANMLADISERLPGADVDVVTSAIGLDTRIGRRYLKGALGYGGPCFPRDTVAFSSFARHLGAHADLAEATDRINRRRIDSLLSKVTSRASADAAIGVLGLSYKPGTVVVEEAQGVALAALMARQGRSVMVYDPAALGNAQKVLGDSVSYAESAAQLARACDVIVIVTAWDEFRNLSADDLHTGGRRKAIIDCWRILDSHRLAPVADIVYLGHGDVAALPVSMR